MPAGMRSKLCAVGHRCGVRGHVLCSTCSTQQPVHTAFALYNSLYILLVCEQGIVLQPFTGVQQLLYTPRKQ
jgi:hypothetical protein